MLIQESSGLLYWVIDSKQMYANSGKFRSVVLGKRELGDCESFTIQKNTVKCEYSVKILAVTFDCMLNDALHISDI